MRFAIQYLYVEGKGSTLGDRLSKSIQNLKRYVFCKFLLRHLILISVHLFCYYVLLLMWFSRVLN
jgi:hypothetical protein